MDLLDLWCGCLSWRKLAQLVRWLPRDAALYESMRLARPAVAAPQGGRRLVVTDPLAAMQHGYLEDLVLTAVNLIEAGHWARADPGKRGPFMPTLPRGFGRTTDAGSTDDADLQAYFAGIKPAPDDQPEV